MRGGLTHLPVTSIFPSIEGGMIRSGIESLAREFIAEKELEAAQKSIRALWEDGFACSVDLLGEVVVSDEEARGYAERYRELLNRLAPLIKDWEGKTLLERVPKSPFHGSIFLSRCPLSIRSSTPLTGMVRLPLLRTV